MCGLGLGDVKYFFKKKPIQPPWGLVENLKNDYQFKGPKRPGDRPVS